MRITKITLIRKKAPETKNINETLLRFGESLGLFSVRDKDKSCYRIFIVLVKALRHDYEITSDEIADRTGLSRGTVVHHLNRLMDTGIVTNTRNKYLLNVKNLQDLVKQMRDNVTSVFDEIDLLAKQIDNSLELN